MALEEHRTNASAVPDIPGPFLKEDAEKPAESITPRAVLIGFIAIIPAVFWGVYGDVVSQTDLTSTSLMMPPVLMLAGFLVINGIIRRIKPRWVFTQAELVTIYTMLTVSVVLSGMGMIQFLCTTLGAVPYYKTSENGWGEYLKYVPAYVLPKLSAIEGFYKGNTPVPWSAWTKPILYWSAFLLAMLFSMTCINSIMRKQWMDRERLTFPIIQLPLEMTDPRSRFFKSRVMWSGFLIAAALESLNSLNYLYPSFPLVRLRAFDLAPSFAVQPWNAIGYFPTTFYPLAIGLGFVLSADVSFSCWFFYLVTKFENVFVSGLGWTGGAGALSTPPYLGQQGAGAFFGIGLSVVFLARGHLMDVFAKAFRRDSNVDDSAEPMSYRMATLGLLAGFSTMVFICSKGGMSAWLAVIYLGVYILFAATITRLRAVAGPPWTMGPDWNAMNTVVQPVGSALFSKQNLVALAYFNWFSIEMRCCPMPSTIEGMKMAQATRVRQRVMMLVMLLAIAAGIAVGFWACLGVWYQFGAATGKVEAWRTNMGRAPFDRISSYLLNPTKPDVPGVAAMGFGAFVVLALSVLRNKFVSFPFHPAGYVLANTGTMYWLWCPFLIAWSCKVAITKYGGIKGYRAALPFFLGLVLGDYITSSLWALAGSVLGIRMYRCFPC